MTDNINITTDGKHLNCHVLLGDKKINAHSRVYDGEEHLCLVLEDKSDKDDREKLNVYLDFKSLESVLIMKEWLNGIADTFERIRVKKTM